MSFEEAMRSVVREVLREILAEERDLLMAALRAELRAELPAQGGEVIPLRPGRPVCPTCGQLLPAKEKTA